MPFIPLPKTSTPLAPLPNAVLDRERRPTVDSSGVAQAARQLGSIKNPEISGNAMAAPFEELGVFGRSISPAGGLLGAAAIEQAHTESRVQVSRADATMAAARAKFDAQADGADPIKWKEMWDKNVAPLKGQLLATEGLRPAAKAEIEARFENWSMTEGASVDLLMRKAVNHEDKVNFMGEISSAMQTGKKPRFEALLTGPDGQRHLHEWQREKLRQDFEEIGRQKEREAKADAVREAVGGSITMAEGFGEQAGVDFAREQKDLDPQVRMQAEASARQAARVRQGEAMDALAWMRSPMESRVEV